MAKFKFAYWNTRGLAQVPRLLAAYVGTELEETRYTQWNKWHGQDKHTVGLDFPNLPYLIDGDFKLTESEAIKRYIILQSGHEELLGKTTKDRARVDNLYGVLKDALKQIRGLVWNKDVDTLKDAALEKVKSKFDHIEAFIGDNKFALGYLTFIDFEISEASYYIQAMYPQQYSKWSFWQTIRQNFNDLPEIVNYYSKQGAMIMPFVPTDNAFVHPKFNNKLILAYWGIRGLVHQARILLSYVGLPFEDKLYTSQQQWFEKDKKNLGFKFPNLPYLIDGEFKITQSQAIHRYIINKSQHKELLGKNIQDSVRLQSVLGVFSDVFTQVGKNFRGKDEQVLKQTLQKITPKFEYLAKFIGERSTVLEYITLADFIVAERSHYIEALFPEQYKKWQFLDRIRKAVNNLESTKAYYSREGAVKGPFLPPTVPISISFDQYK